MSLLLGAAALMTAIAVVHSLLGERRLIGPIIRERDGVMASPLARAVLRFAWHLTSLLMVVTALVVAWPGTPPGLIRATGAAYLLAGLADAAMTRGRHVGWPMLSAAGLLALIGAM